MRLALETFPPSSSFENYLEIYLRNKDPSDENPLRRALHQVPTLLSLSLSLALAVSFSLTLSLALMYHR